MSGIPSVRAGKCLVLSEPSQSMHLDRFILSRSERLEIPCIYPKIGGQVRPRPASSKKKHSEREQSTELRRQFFCFIRLCVY